MGYDEDEFKLPHHTQFVDEEEHGTFATEQVVQPPPAEQPSVLSSSLQMPATPTEIPCVDKATAHAERAILKNINPSVNLFSCPNLFSPLGIGTVLYLHIHFYVIVLVLIIAVASIPALNAYSGSCSKDPASCNFCGLYNPFEDTYRPCAYVARENNYYCDTFSEAPVMAQHSLFNRPGIPPRKEIAVAEIVIAAAYIFVYFMIRRSQMAIENQLKVNSATVADYSVFVTNLPPTTPPEEIASFFAQWGKVVNVVCLSDTLIKMQNTSKKIHQIREMIKRHKVYSSKPIPNWRAFLRKIFVYRGKDLAYWERSLKKEHEYLKSLKASNGVTKYTGHAFVTFNMESEAAACLSAYNQFRFVNFFAKCFPKLRRPAPLFTGGFPIKVKKAPATDDVNYKNFAYPPLNRFVRQRILSPLIATLILLGTLLVVTAIKVTHPEGSFTMNVGAIFQNAGISLAIFVAGLIIAAIFTYFVTMEKHLWKSSKESVAIVRLFAVQLVNSVIITFVVSVLIMAFNWDANNSQINTKLQRYHLWCLNTHSFAANAATTVFAILITMSVLPNLIRLSAGYRKNLTRRRLGPKAATQKELNELYEGVDFDMADQFAYIFVVLYYVLFYSSLFPFIPFVGCFGLVFCYFTNKYNLIHHCKKPPTFDGRLLKNGVLVIVKLGFLVHAFMSLAWFWFNFNGGWFTLTCSSLAAIKDAPHHRTFLPLLAILCFGVLWILMSIFPIETGLLSYLDKKKDPRVHGEPYSADLGAYVTREKMSRPVSTSYALFHKKEKLMLSHFWDRERAKSMELRSFAMLPDLSASTTTATSEASSAIITDTSSENSFNERNGDTTRESSAASFVTDTSAAPTREPSLSDLGEDPPPSLAFVYEMTPPKAPEYHPHQS